MEGIRKIINHTKAKNMNLFIFCLLIYFEMFLYYLKDFISQYIFSEGFGAVRLSSSDIGCLVISTVDAGKRVITAIIDTVNGMSFSIIIFNFICCNT